MSKDCGRAASPAPITAAAPRKPVRLRRSRTRRLPRITRSRDAITARGRPDRSRGASGAGRAVVRVLAHGQAAAQVGHATADQVAGLLVRPAVHQLDLLELEAR